MKILPSGTVKGPETAHGILVPYLGRTSNTASIIDSKACVDFCEVLLTIEEAEEALKQTLRGKLK